MNSKSRSGMMIIAGGYLVYLGVKLMRDVINDGVGNSLVFMICAVFFMVVGALVTIFYVKNMIKLNAEEAEETEEEETEEEETQEEEHAKGIEAEAGEQATITEPGEEETE